MAARLGMAVVVHAACLRPYPRPSVGFPVVLGDLNFLQHKLSNLVLLFFLERPFLLGGRRKGRGKE